ncbi:MAG: ROK family protein [Verrucomicrobiota bacterium]
MIAFPQIPAQARPGLLRRVNRERVVRSLQTRGPLSRSDVAKHTGLGYATAVKICDSLEASSFAESCSGQQQNGAGRPGNFLRMSADKAQVIALALGPIEVRAASIALNGAVTGQMEKSATPQNYASLLEQIIKLVKKLDQNTNANTLGLGVCVPGLIDSRSGEVKITPNIPSIDGHDLLADLEKLTGLKTKLTGVMESQFLVEQIRGQANGLENFALINYLGGLGAAACSDGHRITGARGMAGEIGHIVINPDGELCGCGNHGCLETQATDLALLKQVTKKLDREVSIAEMLEIQKNNPQLIATEVSRFLDHLAIAIALTLQAYNPSTVFLLGRFLENDAHCFDQLIERLPRFCLSPLLENCQVKLTRADPLNGAGLAIIEQLIAQLPTKS